MSIAKNFIGGSPDNPIIHKGNETYEWDFNNKYIPSRDTIEFFMWEREFFENENKTPPFHYFIMDNIIRRGFQTKSIECYRGAAKSTLVNLKYMLYLAYKGETPEGNPVRYVYLASASIDLIKGHLETIVENIDDNPKLSAIFTIKKRRMDEYPRLDIMNNATGKMFIVEGKSPTQKIRGKKAGKGFRADMLVMDDVESKESVKTAETRKAMNKWLTEDIYPSLKKTAGREIIIIGTPLHSDSILSNNTKDSGTTSVIVKACKNFSPLKLPKREECAWLDMYPPETIMQDYEFFKKNQNVLGFWQEIMMQLKSDDALLFDTGKIQWYHPREMPDDIEIFVSLDASTGRSHSDDGVFTIVGVRPNGIWYVLNIIKGKFDIIALIDNIFKYCEFYSGNLVIEEGIIFNMLEPLIERKMIETGVSFEILTVKRNTVLATGRSGKGNGKLNVFKMLVPRVMSGRLYLPSHKEAQDGVGELLRQMEGVTSSAILVNVDDVLDSLAQLELLEEATYQPYGEDEYQEILNNGRNGSGFISPYIPV